MATQKRIITLAIIFSIVLYLAGVFSGLYANKVIEKKTDHDITEIKEKTKKDIENIKVDTEKQIDSLKEYVSFLEHNLKSIQIEQSFTDTLSKEQSCKFSTITLRSLFKELHYYWGILPKRLEEYEKNHDLTPEYILKKKEYTQVTIRAWILAKRQQELCNSSLFQGLYFYSKDCQNCVEQGEELDKLNDQMKDNGHDMMLFTLDIDSDEPVVKLITQYYNITEVPAIVINDHVFQGRLFNHTEIIDNILPHNTNEINDIKQDDKR